MQPRCAAEERRAQCDRQCLIIRCAQCLVGRACTQSNGGSVG
jgi:hypothetical protein